MAQTTFSGPILAGTIKNTTGTTVGTDMKNTGQVVMAQTFAADLSSGAIAAAATDVIIPANSQIIDCVFELILFVALKWLQKLVVQSFLFYFLNQLF